MIYYAKRFFGQQGIVTDGLKLWLDASNPASYPGSGTTWYDLSGNGNNGTMFNGVTPLKNAMQFDGVNDYVNLSVSILNQTVNFSNNFTISCWINQSLQTNESPRMFELAGVNSVILTLDSTGTVATFTLFINNNTLPQSISGSLLVSEYNHIVVTVSAPNINMYINGIIVATLSGVIAPTATNRSLALIGNRSATGNRPLKGAINEPSIYNRALTTDEVLQNFNATRNKYGI